MEGWGDDTLIIIGTIISKLLAFFALGWDMYAVRFILCHAHTSPRR